MSLLPSNNEDDAVAECSDDLNRECAAVAAGYADPAIVLADIADNGLFFETKREYAPEMATAFIRLNGATTGIVANRSAVFSGNGEVRETYDTVLTSDGCGKAADFVRFCDAFEIPVITLTSPSVCPILLAVMPTMPQTGLSLNVTKVAYSFRIPITQKSSTVSTAQPIIYT